MTETSRVTFFLVLVLGIVGATLGATYSADRRITHPLGWVGIGLLITAGCVAVATFVAAILGTVVNRSADRERGRIRNTGRIDDRTSRDTRDSDERDDGR